MKLFWQKIKWLEWVVLPFHDSMTDYFGHFLLRRNDWSRPWSIELWSFICNRFLKLKVPQTDVPSLVSAIDWIFYLAGEKNWDRCSFVTLCLEFFVSLVFGVLSGAAVRHLHQFNLTDQTKPDAQLRPPRDHHSQKYTRHNKFYL